jgi:RNA polymerase sigma-70 factor (ECF subfamily)
VSVEPDEIELISEPQHTEKWDAEWLAFYRDWRPRLLAFLLSITDDTRFVEDVVEDSLLVSRRYWRRIRDYDKPRAYLFKIGKQELRSRQAKDARWHQQPPDQADDAPGRACDLAGLGIAEQRCDTIAAIRRLPRRCAETVALYYYGDYSTAQIAEIQHLAEGTVRAQLTTARQRLSEMLKETSEPGIDEGGAS